MKMMHGKPYANGTDDPLTPLSAVVSGGKRNHLKEWGNPLCMR